MLSAPYIWIWRPGAFNIQNSVMEIQPIKFSEIEKAYNTWCKHHRDVITERPSRISIVDPIFGVTIPREKIRDKEFSLKEIINKHRTKKAKSSSKEKYHGNLNVESTIANIVIDENNPLRIKS